MNLDIAFSKKPLPLQDSGDNPSSDSEKSDPENPEFPPEKDIENRSIIPIEEQNADTKPEIKEPDKNNMKQCLLTFCLLLFAGLSNAQDLKTVASVDLQKYLGKWYEIASFPQRFQKNCFCTTAEYSLHPKGYVTVLNRCKKGSVNGKEDVAKGKAFVQKGTNNTKLKVQFAWPFKGKYWIIDLANDYSYAVVSHPNKKYLWILSRTPTMDAKTYQAIVARAKEQGLNIEKLKKTVQDCSAN